jgi:2,4-dienoyl-CoA reductase (NADPH2)
LFANSTRHLSTKATIRATIVDLIPTVIARHTLGYGWKFKPAASADYARVFKQNLSIPVISDGGFPRQHVTENALSVGKCDMIALARPLLANPDLLKIFASGQNDPAIHPPFAIDAAAGRQCCRSDATSAAVSRRGTRWNGRLSTGPAPRTMATVPSALEGYL